MFKVSRKLVEKTQERKRKLMIWYMESWTRRDKFGKGMGKSGTEVYVLDHKDDHVIKEGKIGYFCPTAGLFHVYLTDEKKKIYADWGDIEPLTDEGYKFLEQREKSITENKENT